MNYGSWYGRRWLEFTKGYSGYLVFALNFSVFITTLYGWVIKDLFDEFPMIAFIAMMIAIIVPIAIFVGHMHFKKQHPIEQEVWMKNNPFTWTVMLRAKEIILINAQIQTLKVLMNNSSNTDEKNQCAKSIEQLTKLMEGVDSREII